jgi:hypothetical protein
LSRRSRSSGSLPLAVALTGLSSFGRRRIPIAALTETIDDTALPARAAIDDSSVSRLRLLDAVTRTFVDPVFVLDYDGRYLAALGGSERAAYDSLEYLVGRTMHEALPGELADKFLADVRQVLDTGEPLVYEYTLAAEELDGNPHDGPTGRH